MAMIDFVSVAWGCHQSWEPLAVARAIVARSMLTEVVQGDHGVRMGVALASETSLQPQIAYL
jgi:hypothetical protein